MAKKFKVMASNAKEPDGKCIPKSMRKSVESACGKKKTVKASDSECKYRIDIFKKDNPDALVKREFKMFKSEDEAKKYGESIANGNTVNVMKVNAGCTKKSVKSSIKATTELNDFYNVIYDMDGTWENPTTGWVGKCEIYQRDLDDGSYLFSLVFGDNESEPDEILFVPSEDKFTIYPNSGMPRFANSLSEFKRELKQEYSYLRKVSDSVTSAKKSVKSGKVLFPWAMVGRFADGYTCEVSGDSEADCIEKLGNMQDKHGELEYYSGVDDDDYDADGHRIYSSRTKKFGVKASKAAKKRVAAAKGAKQEYISKEFVNLANDPYLQTAYDSNNLTVSLINGDTILIIAEGPNRAEIERKAKAVAKKIYPQYELYGDTKRYKDVPRDDIKSAFKSKKTVKASAAAKKRVANKKKIAASDYRDDDIVMYFNGDNVYTGSIYDLADAVENLCYDDEVNAKFQEWCNQFGDPFDFDGSPIDTARVFTDIIIHEADEAPETENGGSQFYEDGNGILDFEIFYANDGIYSAKSIHAYIDEYPDWVYDWSESKTKKNKQLYDSKLNEWYDKAESMYPNFYQLKGDDRKNAISDVNKAVGFTMDDVFTSIDIQCSDADGIADEWEDIREIANQDSYEYDGYEDSDMLEYVDSYMQDPASGAWLSADYVVYNNPDDWEVRASLSAEAVETDFWFFLDDVDHDLYEEMLEEEIANPLDEDPIHYVYNQNAVNGNDFFIELYPTNNQMSAPQIDFDEKYLTPEWLDRLVEIRKQYEESRKAAYTKFQNGLGEFLANGITASTDINAGITVGEDSRFDFSNPIYELDDYVKAIADGVINRIQGITYDISKETIAFFDKDNNVVFVQPIGGIIPEPDDLETDIDELSAAIQSEMDNAYAKDNWGQDEDDSDYASRAVELSEDIGEVDIDDLEYVTGEDDEPADMGYGFDSNGDPIDESTVEELYRIAEYEILPKSELAKIDEYVSIDEDSWDFYLASPTAIEKFYIHFKLTEKDINLNDYALPDGKMFPDFNYYTADLDFDIYVENGEITSVILEDKKIYRPDGAYDEYDVKRFEELYNVEALINYVEHLAADTVKDIYNGTTNL